MTKLVALLLTTTLLGLGLAVLAEGHASGQHPDSAAYDVTKDPVCKAYDEKSQQSFKTRGTLFATCTQGQSGDLLSREAPPLDRVRILEAPVLLELLPGEVLAGLVGVSERLDGAALGVEPELPGQVVVRRVAGPEPPQRALRPAEGRGQGGTGCRVANGARGPLEHGGQLRRARWRVLGVVCAGCHRSRG